MREPEAGRRAVRIGEDRRALGHLRLAPIDRGHLPAASGEPPLHRGNDLGVLVHRQAEVRGHDLARQVVIGGAQSPGQNQHAVPTQGVRDVGGQLGAVVSHDRLERHGDAEVIQDLRDEERVGVDLLGGQQLTAHGEDRRRERAGVYAVSHDGIHHMHSRSTRYE